MSEPATAEPPVELAFPAVGAARALLTGRACGDVSLRSGGPPATAARERALARLGVSLDDAVFAGQVHAARVAPVGSADRGRGARNEGDGVPETDALVTTEAGVALCIQVADCVPVALALDAGPGRRGVGAVHAGRGGVQAGVVGAAVAALAEATGAGPADVAAVVGAGIGGCCYEVPAEMALELAAVQPEARATTGWGSPAVDLPAAVRAQLRAAGVARVAEAGSCTRCHPERWFSHRAWQAGEAAAGRQMLAVVLDPGAPADPGGRLV